MAADGIIGRIGRWWRSRSADSEARDPERLRGNLDQVYRDQLELLTKVRRGVADVRTSRRRVEVQMARQREQVTTLEAEAREAVARDDEDAARAALTRKVTMEKGLADLESRHATLAEEEAGLERSADQVEQQIEDFRRRKDTLNARYSAANARAEINDATRGIASATSGIGQAMDAAERHTRELEATADAVDELAREGVIARAGESEDEALRRQIDQALAETKNDEQKGNDGPQQISS